MSAAPTIVAPPEPVPNKLMEFEQRRASRQLEQYQHDVVATALIQSNILTTARTAYIDALRRQAETRRGDKQEETYCAEHLLLMSCNKTACDELLLQTLVSIAPDFGALWGSDRIAKRQKK